MSARYAGLPRAFNLSAAGYFLDFVLMPPAAGALFAFAIDATGGSIALAWCVAGVMLWQAFEYAIHRVLFHAFAPLARMHDIHHANPKGFVGVASWLTFVGFGATFGVIAVLAGVPAAAACVAGILLGYLFYCAIHIRMHHGDRARLWRYTRFMRELHAAHHRGGDGNFGVSSPLFDLIFRTYRPVR